MKTFWKKGIMAVMVVFAFFAAPYASAGDIEMLSVDFEKDPLFSESNFVPGDSIERWIKVTNNSPDTQSILIEAINITNKGDLGDDLILTIKEGVLSLYSASLSDFFDAGRIFLSSLPGNGENTQYDLIVDFPKGSDDASQKDNISFDILIGFEGGELSGGTEPTLTTFSTGGGGGSSGGGGSGIPGLVISNEAVFDIVPEEGTANAYWSTSHAATSQVVYGLASDGPYYLDLSDPNYGYPFATPEDDAKVTEHFMDLAGLTQGETYVYRVISHASPATVSFERTFTVPVVYEEEYYEVKTFNENTSNVFAGGGFDYESKPISSVTKESIKSVEETGSYDSGILKEKEVISISEEDVIEIEKVVLDEERKENGLAAVFGIASFKDIFSYDCLVTLLILAVLAYLVKSHLDKKYKNSELSKREVYIEKIKYFLGFFVALLLVALIFKFSCASIVLALISLGLLLALFLKRSSK